MKKIIIIALLIGYSISSYSQDARDFYINGINNIDQKKYNDAIADFTRAIEQVPKFEEAYLKRGACYEILQDNGSAVADFTKVLEINPKNAVAYYNRGLAYKDLNELNHSIVDFSKALELDPTNKYAVYNRALVKLQLDQVEDACVDLARAADMGIEHAAEIIKYTCKHD
jgi:tetratricopeptide (TPR) repeat protein